MKNKLINMTDFVLNELEVQQSTSEFKELVRNYAKFLKQPLQLGFFVPCDEEGNVLEVPNKENYKSKPWCETGECKAYFDDVELYNEAKERCLFEGFEYKSISKKLGYVMKGLNIDTIYAFPNEKGYIVEDLCKLDLTLSPNALKNIYG